MTNKKYIIQICEATNPEIKTKKEQCVSIHTVHARKSKENEPDEFIFSHPYGINEKTHAYSNYEEIVQSDYKSKFHVHKIIKNKN